MTIHHHSHPCPLVRYECGSFTCNGCGRCGTGARYRCHSCDFDLHLSCAKYSFPCHGHELTYQPCVRRGAQIVCNVCDTRVCGAHYTCAGCNFDVHPNCVQRQPCPPPTPRPCPCHTVYCQYCVQCNPGRRRC